MWQKWSEPFNQGDIDGALEVMHPEVELKPALEGIGVIPN
jgi:hypothetical protein